MGGIRHNNFGFRGKDITLKKHPNSVRIIFMGGSTTYESGIGGGDKVFTEILEDKLNQFFEGKKSIEVINAGVPTWSSVHSLINFATYLLDFEPDIIFLMDGLNDAAVRISDNSRSDYAEYYKPMQIPPLKIWESSAFLSTILRKYTSPANKWWPNYWHGLVDVTNDPKISKWIQSQYPYVNEMTQGNMEAHSPYPFERNILSLIGITRQFGIKVVLLTTPILNISHNKAKAIEALLENHHILKSITEKENIPFIDLYNLIPQREELYADIYHLNSKGQPIKAEKLFEEIVSKKIIEARPLNDK
ncbi:MAG: SGNH/GDSL hydrolase family protein [Nitrospinae bacterium]|nr:SGNH/GDSL hydrolase family protein [Nitrospinota bacterium]